MKRKGGKPGGQLQDQRSRAAKEDRRTGGDSGGLSASEADLAVDDGALPFEFRHALPAVQYPGSTSCDAVPGAGAFPDLEFLQMQQGDPHDR
jgi:hypothetical protein